MFEIVSCKYMRALHYCRLFALNIVDFFIFGLIGFSLVTFRRVSSQMF